MNSLTPNTGARCCLAITLLLLATATVAQSTTIAPPTPPVCQSIFEQRQAVIEKIKIQDALLLEKVTNMQSAQGDNKIKLIADIVTDLVQQRIAVDQWKAKMAEMIHFHQSLDMPL